MSPYFTNSEDLFNWFMLSRFIRPNSWQSLGAVFGWPYNANIPPEKRFGGEFDWPYNANIPSRNSRDTPAQRESEEDKTGKKPFPLNPVYLRLPYSRDLYLIYLNTVLRSRISYRGVMSVWV
ncbi:hypothetical protein CEXT_56191 [Caerostris extrusa]|uniref:Uncharacterized protein n=1 Tax=Caerostris extrusa TaxID=172846 RepID=A0AAV4MED9_CAEEX|nr:hypothetical protein CEXT_56191 [Caerostris extrusa]